MSPDLGIIVPALIFGLAAAVAAPIVFGRLVAAHAERAVPPLGEITSVDGTRLHWVGRGSGPAVVLVHGLGTQMRSLTHPLLDDLERDFRVLALDRPGSGWSEPRRDGRAGLRADADMLAAFIRDRGLERPVIVGHSLGGAIALATAVHHPDTVGGLALLAPLTRLVDDPPDVLAPLEVHSPLLRRLVAATVAVPATLLRERATLREIFAPEPVSETFAVQGGGMLARRPKAFVTASKDLVSVPDDLPEVEARYGSLDLPLGILYGEGDRILAPDVHGVPMRDRVPDATVRIVEGGHMIPFTQPELTSAFVREMAARVRR